MRPPEGGYIYPPMAKGGRVPSTGTYKLHAGEVVVPTKAADVMFPYAQGGGPARSSGAPRASYQGGSMGLENIARGMGYGAGQLGAGLTSIHDLIRNLSRQFGAGATGLGAEAQPETITPEPLPSGTPMGPPPQAEYQDLGIRGLRESVGEAGERKFELQGAPGEAGTDREKLTRLDDEAARWDREADYHEAKLNKVLSFVGGDPSRMNPEAQRMVRERMTLAKQFRQREMDYRKRADALRKDLMTTETQKDITAIAATGDIERERTKAMAAAQVEARKAGESLYSDLSSIVMSARTEANPEAARGAVMMRLQPYRGYVVQLAAREGAEDPEAAADTIIQQIVDGLIGGKYDEAVGALSMIVNSLG